jgi:hypothetical protein
MCPRYEGKPTGLGFGAEWLRAVCWDNPVALFGAPVASGA